MVRRFFERILEHYDKVLLFLVLAGLLFSLAYLAVQIRTIQDRERVDMAKIEAMRPRHPEARPVDTTALEEALALIRRPFAIPEWKGNLFVPETRVTCVDCRRPIPIEAEVCPSCKARQPEGGPAPGLDSDKDGMPDAWEIAQGFDPNDARDAHLDADKDLWSNLQECRAGTNPRDPNDHPPYETALQLKALIPDPFMLRFKSSFPLPGRCVVILSDGREMPVGDRYSITLAAEGNLEVPRREPLSVVAGSIIEVSGTKLTLARSGAESMVFELARNENIRVPVESTLVVSGKEPIRLSPGYQLRAVVDLKFQINTRGDARTFFVKLGDVVEGFEVYKYDERFVEEKVGTVSRKVDVSVLTLKRGDKLIPLEKGKDVQYDEYTVHLVFELDGTEFKVKKDEEFDLMGRRYKLTAIDSKADRVVIRRTEDDKELEIGRHPGGGTGGEKSSPVSVR